MAGPNAHQNILKRLGEVQQHAPFNFKPGVKNFKSENQDTGRWLYDFMKLTAGLKVVRVSPFFCPGLGPLTHLALRAKHMVVTILQQKDSSSSPYKELRHQAFR